MSTKVYIGTRSTHTLQVEVTVHVAAYSYPLQTVAYSYPLPHVIQNYPALEWGYPGIGSQNLALSILMDHLGEINDLVAVERTEAYKLYEAFARDYIAKLPVPGFQLTDRQVQDWINMHRALEAPHHAHAER